LTPRERGLIGEARGFPSQGSVERLCFGSFTTGLQVFSKHPLLPFLEENPGVAGLPGRAIK